MGYHAADDTLTYVYNNNKADTWDWGGSVKIPKDTWGLVAIAVEKRKLLLTLIRPPPKNWRRLRTTSSILSKNSLTLSLVKMTVVVLVSIKDCWMK